MRLAPRMAKTRRSRQPVPAAVVCAKMAVRQHGPRNRGPLVGTGGAIT